MGGMLELSDQEFKTTIKMLTILMDKVDSVQVQMGKQTGKNSKTEPK